MAWGRPRQRTPQIAYFLQEMKYETTSNTLDSKMKMKIAFLSGLVFASADQDAWRPEASDGTQCLGSAGSYGHSATCLPSWKPTWDMKRSTVLCEKPPTLLRPGRLATFSVGCFGVNRPQDPPHPPSPPHPPGTEGCPPASVSSRIQCCLLATVPLPPSRGAFLPRSAPMITPFMCVRVSSRTTRYHLDPLAGPSAERGKK